MRWAGLCVAAGVAAAVVPARADLVVTISKSQQRMSVAVDGNEAHRWLISTGRGRYATPAGQFRPVRFEKSWFSRKYDWAPMPHSIFFYKGYAIHGTTEIASLGRVASHGCVRLHPTNAATLFELARAERRVRIVVTDGRLPGIPAPSHQAERNDSGLDAFGMATGGDAAPRMATLLSAKVALPKADIKLPRHADLMKPGVHVATMKVGSEAELRAVYKKYGFTW